MRVKTAIGFRQAFPSNSHFDPENESMALVAEHLGRKLAIAPKAGIGRG